ncbi:MAG: sulfatase-like hydrolase/transferase [bacterium]|nr:sulfatase-like hydrolase/transferase [bacterium]
MKINFSKNKLIINISAGFLFCVINIIYIAYLFAFSNNIFLEVYKWSQLLAIIILCLFFIKNSAASFFTALFIYCFYLILVTYFIFTGSELDYPFLARNFKDIPAILPQFLLPAIVTLIAGALSSFSIHRFKNIFKKNFPFILPALILVGMPFITRADKLNNEFIYFIKTVGKKDKAIDYYQDNIYNNLIEQSIDNKKTLEEIRADKAKLPKYLDNIIILQLESLNAFLVSEKNTPNFLEIAKAGIFFPKFYGNGVQTILAQENILCSLPNSFDFNLVKSGGDKKVLCLPEALKFLGYKNIFIKSYDLKFTRTGAFMENIGFGEIHADDIMKKDDPKYLWGWREDIFYKRAFDYLGKNRQDKFNFFYIETGPTNHWQFKTPAGMEETVPFKNPKNHQERLTNTTHLQDQYLKIAWDELNEMFPEKNYTLLILGDHSWPAEIHPDNTFNQKGNFEENFLTSMIIVLGDEKKFKGKIINSRRSEMDIMPSILELLGAPARHNKFSSSFIDELNNEEPDNKEVNKNKILLIQPYSDKYFSIIDYPAKYQYNSEQKIMSIYDLLADPEEKSGRVIKDKNQILDLIKELISVE